MILTINELLADKITNNVFRVLWIDEGNKVVYLIDIGLNKAHPFKRLVDEVNEDLVLENLIKIKQEPFIVPMEILDNEKHIFIRDNAWNVIKDIVKQEPEIYEKAKRTKLVNHVMEMHGVSYPAVHKYLQKYWQRGKTIDALLPDFHKSGAKGMERIPGSTKRGRPRKEQEIGINVDEDTKQNFRHAIEKYYLTTKKIPLTDVYKMLIRKFYVDDYYYEDGAPKLVIKNKIPTFGQFRYWYLKEYTASESTLARQGRKKYEKDFREVLGSSTFEAFGPGYRFQIDATIADFYLISSYNPDWIIGRPVLYVVIDVFSRLITGMYVGVEGPSWMGAMMALENTVSDKVEFCKKYGITITKGMWPSEHLPEVLLADRGELEGYNIERLVSAFSLHVENTSPYRADWKGIVEKKFDSLQQNLKPFVPGYVQKDFQERGTRDYRLESKLTLETFTKIMIKEIIKYNTSHYLSGYLRDEQMIKDDIKPVPIELWSWGVKNRSGKLRFIPQNLVRLHLLPQDSATITYKGIRFKGMYYSCEKALKEGWFSNARQKGNWKVTITYDPRNVSYIYMWNGQDGQIEECFLLDHQERYLNKSINDIELLLDNERKMKRQSEHGQLGVDVSFMADVEEIVKKASKEANKNQSDNLSKSERIKSIRDNRKREREEKRKEEAFVFVEKQEENAEVIPLHNDQLEDYSRPSIKEILRRRKEKESDD